jgi:hypothetical protein
MRFEMGMFDHDPAHPNALDQITTAVVGSPAHQQMSLDSARAGMVLLKNIGGALPFPPGGKVALIGRVIDNYQALTGNYDGPLCPNKTACWPSIAEQVKAMNGAGATTTETTSASKAAALAAAADRVVMVIDNAADGGGEGHDRTSLTLSAAQQKVVDAVLAAKKPLALVMVSGGMISIDGLKNADGVSAIVAAQMPGVHGAQAIAETLFGANNPGGKLPATMYHSSYVERDFLDMDMTNRTCESLLPALFPGTQLATAQLQRCVQTACAFVSGARVAALRRRHSASRLAHAPVCAGLQN